MIRQHIRVYQVTIIIFGTQLVSEWLILFNVVKYIKA